MIDYTATYTDQYELAMAQLYFMKGVHDEKAVFDYFFRKLPFGGGYAMFAGLEDLLDILENLRFDERDLAYLEETGFPQDFCDYLKGFRFTGNIHAVREGELVFPAAPVLQVEGSLAEAQIVETLLLNILNFQTLIATKASRMRLVAGERKLVDFGLRRAHGPGGYYASRAAVAGGFDASSNVRAGRDYGIPVTGTMAHAFVQSYDDELSAFRDFAEGRPDDCVLLVDTYDTLKSGVPNAITVGKELEARGHRMKGIRLDSGDLAYLARESRRMLDEAGLDYVKIAASNELDEHVIKSLNEQDAPLDLFGVGTRLVTGQPDAAFDGVYKLAFSQGKPRIKLSQSISKITMPHKKQVFRLAGSGEQWIGADAVTMDDETVVATIHDPFEPGRSMDVENCAAEPLLHKVMAQGRRCADPVSLPDIAAYGRGRLAQLPPEYKRFTNPHIYKVGMSGRLKEERDRLIRMHREESA